MYGAQGLQFRAHSKILASLSEGARTGLDGGRTGFIGLSGFLYFRFQVYSESCFGSCKLSCHVGFSEQTSRTLLPALVSS